MTRPCLDCQPGMPCAWCTAKGLPVPPVPLSVTRCTRAALPVIFAALATLNLAACADSHTPTVIKTEVVKCPPRAPAPACIAELPVDVADELALEAYVKAPTPRELAQRVIEALKGWGSCAAEVKPWRAGWDACE